LRQIELTVNGVCHSVTVDDDTLLLDVLRQQCGAKSIREGCGVGVCGACTAIADGTAISSCLALAVRYAGCDLLTAEGLGPDHPVVEAFVSAGAMQCGYCTPGFVLMVCELLTQHPDPTEEQIEAYLASAICRCGAYPEILEAVGEAIAAKRAGSTDFSRGGSRR
jgi:aerobic-type carbon monoxide dehydrogenase small subunit (CoxS/CutS family)